VSSTEQGLLDYILLSSRLSDSLNARDVDQYFIVFVVYTRVIPTPCREAFLIFKAAISVTGSEFPSSPSACSSSGASQRESFAAEEARQGKVGLLVVYVHPSNEQRRHCRSRAL
jgi:hypothetical protein